MKNKILVIAEAGVNHNGSLNNALKMVDLAAKAGAKYVSPFISLVGQDSREQYHQNGDFDYESVE